ERMELEGLLADEEAAQARSGAVPPPGGPRSRAPALAAAGGLAVSALALAGGCRGAFGGARAAPSIDAVSSSAAATAAETLLVFCDNWRDIELNRRACSTRRRIAARLAGTRQAASVSATSSETATAQYALKKGTCLLWSAPCSRVRNACWNDYVWGEGSGPAAASSGGQAVSEPTPTANSTTKAAGDSNAADKPASTAEPTSSTVKPTSTAEQKATAAADSDEADELKEDGDKGSTSQATWSLDASGTGCKNWAELSVGESVEDTAQGCGQKCAAKGGECAGFNFQPKPSDKCKGSGVDKGACTLYSGACEPESNDCWDYYVLEGASTDAGDETGDEAGDDDVDKFKEAIDAGDKGFEDLNEVSVHGGTFGWALGAQEPPGMDRSDSLAHARQMLRSPLMGSPGADGDEVLGRRARGATPPQRRHGAVAAGDRGLGAVGSVRAGPDGYSTASSSDAGMRQLQGPRPAARRRAAPCSGASGPTANATCCASRASWTSRAWPSWATGSPPSPRPPPGARRAARRTNPRNHGGCQRFRRAWRAARCGERRGGVVQRRRRGGGPAASAPRRPLRGQVRGRGEPRAPLQALPRQGDLFAFRFGCVACWSFDRPDRIEKVASTGAAASASLVPTTPIPLDKKARLSCTLHEMDGVTDHVDARFGAVESDMQAHEVQMKELHSALIDRVLAVDMNIGVQKLTVLSVYQPRPCPGVRWSASSPGSLSGRGVQPGDCWDDAPRRVLLLQQRHDVVLPPDAASAPGAARSTAPVPPGPARRPPGGTHWRGHPELAQDGAAPPAPAELPGARPPLPRSAGPPAPDGGPRRAPVAAAREAGGAEGARGVPAGAAAANKSAGGGGAAGLSPAGAAGASPAAQGEAAVERPQLPGGPSSAAAVEGPRGAPEVAGAPAAGEVGRGGVGTPAGAAVAGESAGHAAASFHPSGALAAVDLKVTATEENRYVSIGILWFFFVGLMFWAKHTTCDAYLMPAINVFVDRMRASEQAWLQRWGEEAVAGATICALGCNGPELFCNFIALYTGSDAGIGTVVGSEIFNLLVIIGATIMATHSLPLQLDLAPFARDVFFYGLSVGLLYCVLSDKQVEFWESLVLLAAAMLYVAAVYFTSDVADMLWGAGAAQAALPSSAGLAAPPAGQPGDLPDGKVSRRSSRAGSFHGVTVQVEEVVHSRMTDATHLKRTMDANDFAVETGIDVALWTSQRTVRQSRRPSLGPQLEDVQDAVLAGPRLLYKDLKEVVVRSEGVMDLEFWPHVWEHVTLRVRCGTSVERDELLAKVREYSLGKPWEHEYDASVHSAFVRFKRTLTADSSIVEKLSAFPELIVNVCLMSTLSVVDVKDIRNEGRWGLCFLGGMFWLGLQSYFLLEACDCIHYHIPAIPTSFLGITVCAVGTSFPNAIASVILAQQGQPAAAVANALGSNVQNVFLAMALPWAFYSAQMLSFGAISQDVAGIDEGVLWMMGTLALLLLVSLWPPTFGLLKSHGVLFILVYAAYLVDITAETFGVKV
ncbi:unnamed protein product, partial [Prorocentrum cordatum]